MTADPLVPETRVLAIASHVVSGYVGNKIAVFVLQALGCDVAALNTVQFSNHTGYRQFKGTKSTAQEITDLYDGLKQSYLDDFDVMLSGYIPGPQAVDAVGDIAKELKAKAQSRPGSFFWVLDPVMGDNGKIYVAEEVLPIYRSLVSYADLVLPNKFEAELISETTISDLTTLGNAVQVMHTKYNIPHVVITSVHLPSTADDDNNNGPSSRLSVVGSSMTSNKKARLFKIDFPSIDCYFSGTGDMFAALMVVRMREAIDEAPGSLHDRASWLSGDDVAADDLPLARACEKVVASMHMVLSRTCERMKPLMERTMRDMTEEERADEKRVHLARSKAAEVQLVRNLECLRSPAIEFRAKPI